jgi:hypothetical protein
VLKVRKSCIEWIFSSGGLYYKTLRSRNLREMDRFYSKLVTFGLDKYTSLNKQTHYLTTESVDFESVQTPGVNVKKIIRNKLECFGPCQA